MKKSFFLLLSLFTIGLGGGILPAHAAEETELSTKATLMREELSESTLIRHYELNDGTAYIHEVFFPRSWQEDIDNSPNPILETKKKLTAAYLSLSADERYEELTNATIPFWDGKLTISIDNSYKEVFLSDKKEAISYGLEKKSAYDSLSKKEKDEMYNSSETDDILLNYSVLEEKYAAIEKEQNQELGEEQAYEKTLQAEKLEEKKKEPSAISSFLNSDGFILSAFTILIAVLVFSIFRKRR